MSHLIIIRGNSGSGKTTLADALQKKLGRNNLMISQDVIRRKMLWVHDEKNTAAVSLLINLINYGKEHCQYTILEGILNADWYQPLFAEALRLFNNKIFAYYYDLPFEETLKRHHTKKEHSEFGEKEMRCWWKEKDLINFIPEKLFSPSISIEQALDIIYNDVLTENKKTTA